MRMNYRQNPEARPQPGLEICARLLQKATRRQVVVRRQVNPRKTEEFNLIDLCRQAQQQFGQIRLVSFWTQKQES